MSNCSVVKTRAVTTPRTLVPACPQNYLTMFPSIALERAGAGEIRAEEQTQQMKDY
jgi:hypothetical protein